MLALPSVCTTRRLVGSCSSSVRSTSAVRTTPLMRMTSMVTTVGAGKMQYDLYQIRISDAIYDAVNRLGSHDAAAKLYPKYRAHLSVTRGNWRSEFLEHYTHVATIEAQDLEHVFEIGNIGPDAAITRFKPMHSISVGDLVRDYEGRWWFCAPMGWQLAFDERKVA